MNITKALPVWHNGNQIIESYRENTRDGAHHYVLWSGGTDSTLCLYELLEAYGADNVTAISYKFPWLFDTKWETERKYRKMFKDKMTLKGSKFSNFTHVEFTENFEILNMNTRFDVTGLGLPQAIGWLFSLPIFVRDNSYIYAGSIKEDDLTLFTNEYRDIVKTVGIILNRQMDLREPYLYYRKADVLEKLIRYDLYDVTWHCELPPKLGEVCFECVPCKTHYNALLMLWQYCNDSYIQSFAEKKAMEISLMRKSAQEKKNEELQFSEKLEKEDVDAPVSIEENEEKLPLITDEVTKDNIGNQSSLEIAANSESVN